MFAAVRAVTTIADKLRGFGADMGHRLATMVIGHPCLPQYTHEHLERWLEQQGRNLMPVLRPHMSDTEIERELDELAAAFWARFNDVAQGLRHHRPGNA